MTNEILCVIYWVLVYRSDELSAGNVSTYLGFIPH